MKRLITGLSLASALVFSGCSTIVFTNDASTAVEQIDSWHHNVAFSLYEVTPPVAANSLCKNGWSEVKTEKTVINAIAGSLTGGEIWDPWTVSVRCAK